MANIKIKAMFRAEFKMGTFEADFLNDLIQLGLEDWTSYTHLDRRYIILNFEIAQWIKMGMINDLIGTLKPIYCLEDNCPDSQDFSFPDQLPT